MDLSRGLGHSSEAIALSHVMGVLDTICLVTDCCPWGLGLPAMNQQARLHWLPAKRPSCCHPPGLSKLPPASLPTCLQLKATLTNSSLEPCSVVNHPLLHLPPEHLLHSWLLPKITSPWQLARKLTSHSPHLSDLEVWGWGLHPPSPSPPKPGTRL